MFIIGLEGFAERAVIAPWPHVFFRMGAVRGIFGALRANGCKDLVLIGPVRRPSFLDLRPDADGAKMLARIGRAAFAGDDGLLSAVIRVLGEEGFRVLGAHEIMNEVLGPRGLLTRTGPDATAMADIRRGIGVTRALGGVDVGQELRRTRRRGDRGRGGGGHRRDAVPLRFAVGGDGDGEAGGEMVKSVKPGQDRRADLPTIGPDTIRHAADAGLSGVAYDAGGTILAERAACIARADEAGLFLLGFDADIDPVGTTAKGS